jgi:hypothetical protein
MSDDFAFLPVCSKLDQFRPIDEVLELGPRGSNDYTRAAITS